MKSWFQSRNRREQVLVTAFVIMAAVIWLMGGAGRFRAQLAGWQSTQASLAAQQLWLDRHAVIEAQAAAAIRDLAPERTCDATKLVGAITALSASAGLTPAIDSPQTRRTPQFAYHTARVAFRRADLAALLKFNDGLARQAPYLNLEQISLQSDRSTPDALNATLVISATELVQGEMHP